MSKLNDWGNNTAVAIGKNKNIVFIKTIFKCQNKR